MSEQEKEREYLSEGDLIAKPSFARSNIEGYVEEEVDVFVRAAREKFMGFANEYNALLHQSMLDRTEVEDLRERAEVLTQKLEEARNSSGNEDNYQQLLQLQEDYNALVTESQARLNELADTQAASREKDARIAQLENELAEALSHQTSPEPEFDVVPETVVEAPVEQDVVAKAHTILDAAADEAAHHVERTLKRVTEIEEAAQEEAAEIVKDAHREAEEAIASRDEARQDSMKIIESMKNFYNAQLAAIDTTLGSVGYSPSLEDDGSNLNNLAVQGGNTPDEEVVEESYNEPEEVATETSEEEYEADGIDYDNIDTQAVQVVGNESPAAQEVTDETAAELAAFLDDENK